jgi:predicted PolB exonuclease-like 3'-5' exonuclease
MNTLVFDIETVPDVELGRRLYDLDGLDDAAVAQAMFARQRALRQSDFLPPPQQRIAAISVLLRSGDGLKIFSLGDEQSPEKELVQRFFDGLERYSPILVSWNGSICPC